jgi:Mce-associated membrane protein
MVSPDDRRAVALARRTRSTPRSFIRRPLGSDFLPGPEPLESDEPPSPPVRRVVRRPRPRRRPPVPGGGPATPKPKRDKAIARLAWTPRLLLLALVVALTAAGLLGRQWYDTRQADAARVQALAAARQETTDFVSISASTVDSDLQRIASGATGEFKDEFTRDMAQVRAAVVENKVDSKGTVLRAAVVSSDTRTAVVLVAVDATVKNVKAPDGRLSHYRIQVSLAHDAKSGRWLVSQLQFVG